MPVGLNPRKRRTRGGLTLPGASVGGAGLAVSSAPSIAGMMPNTLGDWDVSGTVLAPGADANGLVLVNKVAGGPTLTCSAGAFATIDIGDINGVKAVNVAGGNVGTQMQVDGTSPLNGLSQFWTLWVARTNASCVMFDTASAGNRPHIYTFGTYTMSHGNSVGVGAANGTPHVFCGVFDGTTSKWYVDGSLVASPSLGSSSPIPASTRVGWITGDAASPSAGNKFGRGLIGTGVPSLAQVQAASAALKALWGTP